MKKLALALLLAAATTTTAACSDRVSADDKQAAYRAVVSIAQSGAQSGDIDPETQQRLFYLLCSELKGCAQSCARELAACAKPETDPSQRATLVASCAKDYRQRRDRGEALHPDAWLKERLIGFLDKVHAALTGEEQRQFEAARTKARLSNR